MDYPPTRTSPLRSTTFAFLPVLTAGLVTCGLSTFAAPEVRYDQSASAAEIPHHHLGIFGGAATRFVAPEHEEEETGPAVGIEYEYRFAKRWGAGLLLEGILTDHARDALLALPLNWHPWEWLKLSAAPGIEFVEHGSHEFAVRLGAAYELEFGRFNVAPEVSVDFTRQSQTLVYGLSLGYRF